ncbi:dermonecrotic toxin domain-containing protein [Pseudomonas sp. Pseu.R1]|uniref:dermonecrotic toxin domain-containing protein n=1 Tax=Pseudomonas sp. Pseu.R1 TaxID=3379818 RepID=UPI003B930CD3
MRLTPTLLDATNASLGLRLRETLPQWQIDPQKHLLQVVSSSASDDLIPFTQTLAQAAFEDFCGLGIEEGGLRQFLDAQGRVATPTDQALCALALSNAVASAAEQYGKLLKAFWRAPWRDQRTRRDLAIESFKNSLHVEIYARLHDGSLDAEHLRASLTLLELAPGSLPNGSPLRCQRLSLKVGSSTSMALAGTFVIQTGKADTALLWFSPQHQLLAFKDPSAFVMHLTTTAGRRQLRPALTLQDQPILLSEGALQVDLDDLGDSPFADRIDSILELQRRNLVYAAGLSSEAEARAVMIDDALDIRQLIDPRQLQFSAGRWRQSAPFEFGSVWSGTSVPAQTGEQGSVSTFAQNADGATSTQPLSWIEQTQDFDTRCERLRQLDNVLREFAEQALQQYLCVLTRGPIKASDVQVRWLESRPFDTSDVEATTVAVSETQEVVSKDLVTCLLECVSGHLSGSLPSGAQVFLGASTSWAGVEIALLNHALSKLTANFAERYVARFKQDRIDFMRKDDRCVQPFREAQLLREDAMRLDLTLARRQDWLDEAASDMAWQMLNRPVRALRLSLGETVTEVFSVALSYGDSVTSALGDTLILRQTLSDDAPALIWSCTSGWAQFASFKRLQDVLLRNFHGRHRERWLELLSDFDGAQVRRHLLKERDNQVQLRLNRIDGHVAEALQQHVLSRQQEDVRQLCQRAARCGFEGQLFSRLALEAELDGSLTGMLDELSIRIRDSLFNELLPPWMKSASLNDMRMYYDIFKRYYLASDGGKSFLFDIPSLGSYARSQLLAELKKDFPAHALDPDRINVIARHYVSAFPPPGQLPSATAAATVRRSESLTDYAINRFVTDQEVAISVESTEQPEAVRLLTLDYLRGLVRKIDIGAGYQALLNKALNSENADYATRKRLFFEQLPPMMLAIAMPEKLKGKLSAQAYDFITSVFDMPDGLAREPVGSDRIIISPLQLVADSGMTPDPVRGVYLICTAAKNKGPMVLCSLHHTAFVFREYASEKALLEDIRKDEDLQQLLLGRLDPEIHRRYANGGFIEPHLPFFTGGFGDVPPRAPGPVTVSLSEIKGNALQHLFDDTMRLLMDSGVSNAVTNEQVDQAGRSFLATLGFEQVLTLLPGKLSALVVLWQSQGLFRASVTSASERHWGQALSEFSAALGVMVGAKERRLEDTSAEEASESAVKSGNEATKTSTPVSGWHSGSLTAEQRLQLQHLEANDVALESMLHDKLLNLYRTSDSGTPYAVVRGKVYRVQLMPDDGDWMIVGANGEPGPKLTLDDTQHWQFELGLRLRGGGSIPGRYRLARVDQSAENTITIEASGMQQIRLLYRDRARRIGQAHLKAKRYLENSLDNLHAHQRRTPLDPRVLNIIGDFFGTTSPNSALVADVEKAVKSLFSAVMDPSLSPFSSSRYVVGSTRPGNQTVTAFIIKKDPKQRIFLTERFFNVPYFALKPAARAEGFDAHVHYRAANLIHELSHLILDTHDIAYMESMAPYADLLAEDTPDNIDLKLTIDRFHTGRLSHRSSRASLFTVFENGRRRDLTPLDGRGYEVILRLADRNNLDDARDVFLTDLQKRSRIMLSNADSLTLLILKLGRRNFTVPAP